jgi:hypothetical protein
LGVQGIKAFACVLGNINSTLWDGTGSTDFGGTGIDPAIVDFGKPGKAATAIDRSAGVQRWI